MHLHRKLIATTVAAAALATPAAADAYSGDFHTPTNNIRCTFATGAGGFMDCDIHSSDLSFQMTATGYPRRYQAGSHGGGRTMPYNRYLVVGSFTCSLRTRGLTCRNRAGHGWFMSIQRSYRF